MKGLSACCLASLTLWSGVAAWAGDDGTRASLVIDAGEPDMPSSIAVSADGKTILTARESNGDGGADLWDASTGRLVRTYVDEMIFHAKGVAFSADGKLVAVADGQKTYLWDSATGAKAGKLWEYCAASVVFLPDGMHVLTGGGDAGGRVARLWDLASAKMVREFTGHTKVVTSVAVSRDGKLVLTGSEDKTARVWDASTGKELRRLEGHTAPVTSVAFSPDATKIATGSEGGLLGMQGDERDGTARLWNAGTGVELKRLEGEGGGPLQGVAFSPDGRRLVTGGGFVVQLWDSDSGREVRRLAPGTSLFFGAARFSPDGHTVFATASDGLVHAWDVETGQDVRRYGCFASRVTCAQFTPRGTGFVTAHADGSTRLWDPTSGKGVRRFEGPYGDVLAAACPPEGGTIVTGGYDGVLRTWDASSGKELRKFKVGADRILDLWISAEGKTACAAVHGEAELWDCVGAKQVGKFPPPVRGIFRAGFSSDGKQLVTAEESIVRLYDVGRAAILREIKTDVDPCSVALSPDRKLIAIGGYDGSVVLWDSSTGQALRRLAGHTRQVMSVAFFPDGRRLLTGSLDRTARVWDVATGDETRRLTIEDLHGDIDCVAVSSDGKSALTVSRDFRTRLWDVASSEELCWMVAFRDGSWVVGDRACRYDSSDAGACAWLRLERGSARASPEHLKKTCYDPGLLGKHLGLDTAPLREVKDVPFPR